MRITVIGGGHGSYAAAATLSEQGHRVTWWRRHTADAIELRERGAMTVRDRHGSRTVAVGAGAHGIMLEFDLATALRDATLVVVPLPATSHDDLAAAMAPLLRDGQVVFLPPGTFGSYLFGRALRDAGNPARVAFAETGTLPYLARKHGNTEVVISAYATRLPTGVFPASMTDEAMAVLRIAYPAVEAVEDALSGALMNAGPVIHPPLLVMNAAPLEHFPRWDIHNEGTTPAVRAVTTALDNERILVRKALGYRGPHFPLADHYSADGDEWMYGRNSHERLTDSGDWREHIDLKAHRYMLEDVALGLALLVSVGRWVGVPVPVAESLLAIAGAVTGRDLYRSGRTLESLRLAGYTRTRLNRMLTDGWKPG